MFMVLWFHLGVLWTSFRPSLVWKPSDMFSSRIFFLLCQFFCFLQLLDEPQQLTSKPQITTNTTVSVAKLRPLLEKKLASLSEWCVGTVSTIEVVQLLENTVETLPRQYFLWEGTRGLKSCPTNSTVTQRMNHFPVNLILLFSKSQIPLCQVLLPVLLLKLSPGPTKPSVKEAGTSRPQTSFLETSNNNHESSLLNCLLSFKKWLESKMDQILV